MLLQTLFYSCIMEGEYRTPLILKYTIQECPVINVGNTHK